jgi:hypothetical protein
MWQDRWNAAELGKWLGQAQAVWVKSPGARDGAKETAVREFGDMDGERKEDTKGILIEVTGSEALGGATEDVYRPLSRAEARYRAARSGLWLLSLLGLALIGIALAAIRLYGSGRGGRDLPAAAGHVLILLALSGVLAWTVTTVLSRWLQGSGRVRWVSSMLLWLVTFSVALFSGL